MLNLKTATLLIVAGFVCQTLSAVSLDEFYGVAFGKNKDAASEQSTVPMEFCGLRLGQILPEGLNPSSKTEMYYGYLLSPMEKILCFNQYQFHASLITRTVTSAGAGYTTQSESDASTLFVLTCQWLEEKYPGKKCEDVNLPNRRIKVMRFGKYTDGYYMVEENNPMPGMFLVMITLYNDRLSTLEVQEAKEFAGCNMTGQFNGQQVNQQINNGKFVFPLLTNSISTLVSGTSSSTVFTTPFDKTKATMGNVRDVIEDYQKRGKTRAAPKDILSLKALGKWKVRSWKDAWGKDFQYECDGERWVLQSAGADMKYGTDDDLILICEDGMNVTSVGFPTGNGRYLDSEVVKQNDKLRKKAEENIGNRKDGWTQVEIPGLVVMDIPPTIELQKGAYKALKETMAKIVLNLDLRSQSLTFQQSGLNDFEEDSTRRYARIILKNYYDKDSTYDLADADMTPEAMKFIEDDEYKNLKKGFEQANRVGVSGKLIKWYPVKKVRLSGMTGYRIAFLRQQRDNPPVYVEEYKIGNGHYLHSITFSYRQNEESFWKDDYNEIKKRIKFTRK